MTEQVRYRIDKELLKKAEKICRKLGISPGQAVSMFFAQMANIGGLPFRPSVFPALEEYRRHTRSAQSLNRNHGLQPRLRNSRKI